MVRRHLRRRVDPAGWSDVGVDAIGVVDLVGQGVVEEMPAGESAHDSSPDFAEKLVRRFLRQFENDRTRARMMRLLGSSFASARERRVMFRVIAATVVNPVARAAGLHASAMRMELVIGQLTGMAMMRYVLQVEPLASASVDDVVEQFSPAIRATLQH